MGLVSPGATGSSSRLPLMLAGCCVALWLYMCGSQLVLVMDYPAKLEIAVLAAIMLLPVVVFRIGRMPVYLLAAYAAIVPLGGILSTDSGATFSRLAGVCATVSIALSILATGKIVRPSRSLALLCILVAYMGSTVFWSLNPSLAWSTFEVYLGPIVLCAIAAIYPVEKRDLKIILAAAVAGALLTSAYGHYVFSQPLSADDRLYIRFGDLPRDYIDANEFAAALLVPIAITLMMFVRTQRTAPKYCWLAALLLLLWGLAITGSRGGALAAGAMVLYLLWQSRYRVQLLVMGALGSLPILLSPVAARFGHADLFNADGRFAVWKVGFAAFRQYWLSGAGIGNFNIAYRQYYLIVPHPGDHRWDRIAHSIIVGSAVELGAIGLLLVLVFWFFQFRELSDARGDRYLTDMSLALRAGVLGLFVAGLSLSLLPAKYTWLAFTLVAVLRSSLLLDDPPPE